MPERSRATTARAVGGQRWARLASGLDGGDLGAQTLEFSPNDPARLAPRLEGLARRLELHVDIRFDDRERVLNLQVRLERNLEGAHRRGLEAERVPGAFNECLGSVAHHGFEVGDARLERVERLLHLIPGPSRVTFALGQAFCVALEAAEGVLGGLERCTPRLECRAWIVRAPPRELGQPRLEFDGLGLEDCAVALERLEARSGRDEPFALAAQRVRVALDLGSCALEGSLGGTQRTHRVLELRGQRLLLDLESAALEAQGLLAGGPLLDGLAQAPKTVECPIAFARSPLE